MPSNAHPRKRFAYRAITAKLGKVSKQYQKKSASRRKRAKKGHGPQRGAYQGRSSGVMGGMVQGFRRAVGAEKSQSKKKGNNLLWTAATVALVVAVLLWSFAGD